MHWGLVKSIIILPGTVLVFIPSILVLVSLDTNHSPRIAQLNEISFWLALVAFIIGMILIDATVSLFFKYGKGTPAPWDPPKKLIIKGPYWYMRNPMITGALFVLLAESLFLNSLPIAIWMIIFFLLNTIYFPFFEEKDLEDRFGDDYREYKGHVPCWIPHLRPWDGETSE
jgi:protein-S-isoprenylcysteine O-methyltransferase Ste14